MYLELNINMEDKYNLAKFLRDNKIESKIHDTATEAFCSMEAESRISECEERIGRALSDKEKAIFIEVLAERLFDSELVSDLAYNLADEVTKELFEGEVA